jgi:curved DNA-binding protein
LRGKGWRHPQGGSTGTPPDRTDLMVRIKIVTPKNLTASEKEYYEKLQQTSSFNPRSTLEIVQL